MIVNPQLFNYKIVIGALVIVLAALSIYGFSSYKSIKTYETFIQQEKTLLENELSEILESYDDLSEDYYMLSEEFEHAKIEAKNALDSLKLLKSSLSVLSEFRDQMQFFRNKNQLLLETVDSLNQSNMVLQKQQEMAYGRIDQQQKTISGLKATQSKLKEKISEAALLKLNTIEAIAYKLKANKKRKTRRAKKVGAIDVCMTIAKNKFTQKGFKDIYIQIVGPNNNVLSDKTEIKFGDTVLVYSLKEEVYYDNKDLDICKMVLPSENDLPFINGTYYVNIFHNNLKLGHTSFKLK